MKTSIITRVMAAAVVVIGIAAACARTDTAPQGGQEWELHDMNRPRPTKITPGSTGLGDEPAGAPSDAIVLFDGTDLSQWRSIEGDPAEWKVENGYFEVDPGAGNIQTEQGFGDCQLHIEWAAPDPPKGEGQDRGNSGAFLMGFYEVQVLDSYENVTYADGQATAVYGQYPPLVNASRPPGQWQTYDIVFHAPRFGASGRLLLPARVTVLHNGVLAQDNVEIKGPTRNKARLPYQAHADKLPMMLQDHNHPVRYRNIWVRKLPPSGS